MKKIGFVGLGLGFMISCSEKTAKTVRPFQNHFDFSEEILLLEKKNPVVLKTIEKNKKKETISTTLNWRNELELFVESDINKPQFRDEYEILKEEKKIKYTAKTEKLPVKSVEITYSDNGAVSEIFIRKSIDEFFTKSHYELHYFPLKGYRISVNQSVLFFYDENFFVEGKFFVPREGRWRAALKIISENYEIPFHFNLRKKDEKYTAEILNAEEKILCDEVFIKGDSIFIKQPVFDSELKGKFISDTLIEGAWFNYSKGSDYVIPFYAEYGKNHRLENNSERVSNSFKVDGKWEADFCANTQNFYKAIGIFNQNGMDVTGTFLTETGDYRYLQGTFANDTLLLSCFDGSHAFLFKANLKEQKLNGTFYSGIHGKEPFVAKRNENAKLTNPDSLTFLKDGYSQFSFSFPDLDSNIISLSDKKFQGKVVVVEVMGSWCPNCLDETVFLSEIYKKEHENGLEIVALCFERSPEFSKAKQAAQRFKQQLNAPYDFLIGGMAGTKNANEKLPMLNKIMSFPTTIYIDRTGKVRKIYTGFYGPGTGEYHSKFKEETINFIEKLLLE